MFDIVKLSLIPIRPKSERVYATSNLDDAYDQGWEDAMDAAIKWVEEIKKENANSKAHWIRVTNGRGGFECSNCHQYSPAFKNGNDWLSKFCPACGKEMEGGR